MTRHLLTESLISAGLGALSAMAIIAVLPPQQASVIITLLIGAAIVEFFRAYSPAGATSPPPPATDGDPQIRSAHDAVRDATGLNQDHGIALDLDTTPLIQQHRLDTDQYPNAMIAADPAIARFVELFPETVGSWQESHRTPRFGALKSADATPLLCWVRLTDEDRHYVVVQADDPVRDTAYEISYRYDDFTVDKSTGRRYMAVTHLEKFETAADAVAYAIHWMETYPDGGPGDGAGDPGFPDPAEAPPLPDNGGPATYTVRPDPDTDTTTITQHS